MKILSGQPIQIQSYKHDHSIHRIWKKSVVLEVSKHRIVTANEHAQVIESNGRTWKTKEPAICFFFEDQWFNVIAMIKSDGIHYYCNLASPYVIDQEALKYIDYDLDVKLYPSKKFRILDKHEFDLHKDIMQYGSDIEEIILKQLDVLKQKIQDKAFPFIDSMVMGYLKQYKALKI
jgi:protein associated with RNAse G/E